MSFYVSDITGAQTPYIAELRGHQSISQTQEGMTGTAAASVMYRGREAAGVGVSGAQQLRGERARRRALRQNFEHVTQVTGSKEIHSEQSSLNQTIDPSDERSVNPYERMETPLPKRQLAVRAEQIMASSVITLFESDTIRMAKKLFIEKRFRHVPIVSEKEKLIGIISDRDFIGIPTSEDILKTLMTTNILTARPEAEIRMIAKILFQERIGAMPIVDEHEQLVGIVTRSDILHVVVNHAPLELWV